MSHGMPWNASDPSVPPAWNDWGVIPWLVAIAIGVGALIFGRKENALSSVQSIGLTI